MTKYARIKPGESQTFTVEGPATVGVCGAGNSTGSASLRRRLHSDGPSFEMGEPAFAEGLVLEVDLAYDITVQVDPASTGDGLVTIYIES